MKNKIIKNSPFIIFSILYLLIGILSFKDYGVGIEEHFQRSSGLFWLNHLLEYTQFENLKLIVSNKITELKNFSPMLPKVEISNYYGILFDLPMAFIESIFNIQESENYFYLRHLSNFLIFYLSGIFFYKIIKLRTSNSIIAFFGTTMYLLAPKAYGNSFFDGKDLFFLSILTISIYFFLKFLKNSNFTSIILFALFSAFSTSSRIFGLLLPISFLFLIFLQFVDYKNKKSFLKSLFFYFSFYFIFLILHWPYMWTINLSDLSNFFDPFKVHGVYKVFFGGEFYESNYLPLSYLPKWIHISTPLYYQLLFLLGLFFLLKRVFKRFLNIEEHSRSSLWNGTSEKIDFIILFSFFQVILICLTTNLNLIKGWTHFLFINFFLIYFATISIYVIFILLKKNKIIISILVSIFSLFTFELIYKLFIYHPYQNIYLNNLVNVHDKSLYEVDYQSLSRTDAIKEIIKDSKDDNIVVATASWTPLKNGLSLIPKNKRKNIKFIGTANKKIADYIYTNYFYDVDIRYNNKYLIPNNFYLFKTLYIDDIKVYSIYKKKL